MAFQPCRASPDLLLSYRGARPRGRDIARIDIRALPRHDPPETSPDVRDRPARESSNHSITIWDHSGRLVYEKWANKLPINPFRISPDPPSRNKQRFSGPSLVGGEKSHHQQCMGHYFRMSEFRNEPSQESSLPHINQLLDS